MSKETDGAGGVEDARSSEGVARLLHPVDTLLAILILCIVAWLYYETTQFEEVSDLLTQNIPPQMFPRILLVIVALLALVMPFEHILLKRKGKDIDKDRRAPVKRIAWVTMAALVAIIIAEQWLGTLLTMVAVCLVIPLLWGERRLRFVLPFAVFFPLCVAFLFSVVLGVYFDPGVAGVSIR
ncbi:tripartite tricarboxylate transporter TctB family protein [Pelagibius marinus]|uniref:tripartite tricarboxylate transporter TctB family protein n=1 Tax=Pelagibius marinus TaxID=2762760 RepID=UPI0018725566|nr:tripartite tricarboxylate transporter TctB family protein [Pelagibius marinus]